MSDGFPSTWQPRVLGRDRLDERHLAYLVPAPHDMAPDSPALIGRHAVIEGRELQIRGVQARMPVGPIAAGEPIMLIVRRG